MIDPPTPEMIAAANAERVTRECAIARIFLDATHGDLAAALALVDAIRRRIETGDIDPPQARKASRLRLVADSAGSADE